ncbi:class I SAM-dependent methyltransferase [Brevibacillus migulae]|uniref:class I SAM-dependent methyltransferase n=1 Tax=Brevibacillus migulae TaxID=1644114 RepID=UPI00106EEE61|nr:class I SAM-dependent methyltransferase [Brevibacillus migulae]
MQGELWKEFFGTDYLRFSEAILTPDRTALEVGGIMRLLNLPKGARILDLGCGQGRIAVPLAKQGYQIVAYDGSAQLLDEAKRRAEMAGVQSIAFQLGDMRDLPYENEFDAVINIGTAFGYVQDQEDDLQILKKVYRALKAGGAFLLENENRELKLQNQMGETVHDMNGHVIRSERTFDLQTGRWREVMRWMQGHEEKESILDIRLYTATEMIHMLNKANLALSRVMGGFDETPLTVSSPRLLILSHKRSEA